MKQYLAPIQIGSKKLPNRIFYAPLAGCSDFPFRKMSAQYKPGLMYCEMVKMDALIRHDPHTYHILDYAANMHPIGGQLCGSKPSIAGQAAKIIEELGFDIVDLNCGCPVDKITKDGSGSGLLKTPELIGEIVCNMVSAVKIPVTVKIRAGWDEQQIQVENIVQIVEQAGAQAICIHGRTRQQGYRGPANWEYIKRGKLAAKSIKIIGNGDVLDGPSAAKMFCETGCDAVLVARGTLGQPWIVQDILRYLEGKTAICHSLEDCRQALYHHFLETLHYHPDPRVCIDMRRVGCWYLKKSSGTRLFRELISKASDVEIIKNLILNFPLGDSTESEDIAQTQKVDCCA
ncbi:tRNA-dihydrouridine synthase B [Candidatus Protochlamydia amoebophila]|uniref:tRNA dihydrouridine synthase DusB n=1 Tax=Candidatus Protochlamydia amoebophila TaxID=362787 RepID=UPI001BC99A9F|nr:tRNA dihydrouridine synthase DusB [Candidatus Protochlamydia amoebophila]MBS4163193.1 tRNA-dihydrouridine synthase B [Candidatus Protochlamydia amoebophila]